MARPLWKGHLSFGLVMIPCVLVSCASSEAGGLDLDLIDKRDRQRVRYKRVNEKTGAEVPWGSIVKGYEIEKGQYVILTPEDFKRAAEGVVRGAEIIDFVDRDEISPIYFERPYYLQPDKGGEKGYALLRETLVKTGRVGIAHLVLQTRRHLAALMVTDDVLTLITLRWDQEVRSPKEVQVPRGAGAKATAREVQMAQQLVEGMYTDWEPSKYHDRYHETLRKFIEQKRRTGGKPVKAAEPDEEPVGPYNLMELLKRSVAEGHRGHKQRREGKRKAG